MESNFKKCPRCQTERMSSDFYSISSKKNYCKPCGRMMCKNYKAKNREKVSAYNALYKSDHKEDVSKYNAAYHSANKKQIQERRKKYVQANPGFRFRLNLAKRIASVFKAARVTKKNKTMFLLGCSRDFLLKWITFLLGDNIDNLTIDNYGEKWQIDHVIPCQKFNCETDSESCFNWTNLQPLEKIKNASKGCKLLKPELDNHIKKLEKFLSDNGDIIKKEGIKIPIFDKYSYLDS